MSSPSSPTVPSAPLAASSAPTRPHRSASVVSARSSRARGYEQAGVGGAGAYNLPSSQAVADLELFLSLSRSSLGGGEAEGYRGGGGLGLFQSRRSSRRGTTAGGIAGKGGKGRREEIAEEDEEQQLGERDKETEQAMAAAEMTADKMYNRFSETRKSVIVAIVAYAALLAPFSSSAFLPSIPQICDDLHTTPTILNATVAIYIFVIGVIPLLWAPYAGLYGRRPIYLASLPIFTLGSLGVALSNSLAALIITRIIQGAGSSAVLSVGAGTIGDLYPRHRRGAAMGYFYSGILIGPALAPAIAGVLSEYVKPLGTGWRAMQWLLFAMGVVACVLCFVCFPETSHKRGIELMREERRDQGEEEGGGLVRKIWRDTVFLNPVGSAALLRQPHILLVSINSAFVLMSTYTILVPLSQTLAPRYNITNLALLGCFYIAQGLGNALASQVTGKYADWELKRWLKRRGGVYVPEDRLRATLLGGGVILPCAVLALGWVLDKVGGKLGLGLAVVLLFFDGVGLMFVLTAANTYCVDVMQHKSSEVIAVNNALRYTLSAAASAFVLPLINHIGVGWTNTFSAALCWVGFLLVCLTIKYGEGMRAYGAQWEDSAGSDGAVLRTAEEKGEEKMEEGEGEGETASAKTLVSVRRNEEVLDNVKAEKEAAEGQGIAKVEKEDAGPDRSLR